MAFTCVGVRCSTPRSCFVKPSVEAVPRQVIGFDLSPKGDQITEALPNLNDDVMIVNTRFQCSNPCLISSEAANPKSNTNTATSPRSALQQLLLRPVDAQSEPASSSPAVNQNKVSNGPLPIEPACKPLVAAKQSLRVGLPKSTKPYVERDIPVSAAAHGNFSIFKGIAELVGPSHCARPMNDGRYGISSAAAVSAIKCVARNDDRSRWLGATIHELPRRSEGIGKESSGNIEDQLHELPPCREKSKKSSWMKELMINIERPHSQHEKSSTVEISWKQANKSIPDQSKKGSLFMLAASSPAAEYSKQYPLQGAGHYSAGHNMDHMDFLNSCYLCKRILGEDHDVFMYNGDKAFCSMECRYQQIVIDERKERCAPPIIRSGVSPVYQSYMTTAGVAAVATASAIATTHRPITINRPNFMNPAAAA